jgi:hypothetical protein
MNAVWLPALYAAAVALLRAFTAVTGIDPS